MNYLEIMQNVLSLEADSILQARDRIKVDEVSKFMNILEILRNVGGNLIFCGVGKSGVVARKMASTFSSLGLPAFFLHPVEALHGDLGRVSKSDAMVFISKSGNTDEILRLLPFLPVTKEMTIGLLGNTTSQIGKKCAVIFDCSVDKEACINNQAPTTSSTLAMAMGDALSVAYESMVGLSEEGFAINHPGGMLGKSLLYKVKDLMWKENECPKVSIECSLKDVILEMTRNPVGACAIIDVEKKLQGIIVEGDIRRTFTRENQGIDTLVSDIMNRKPVTTGPDDLAYNALCLMEKRKNQIDILPVVEGDIFLGFLRVHDLLQAGLSIKTQSKKN